MYDVKVASSVAVYATGVFFKAVWDGNTTSDWAALLDFLHHVLFTCNMAELINSVDVVLVWDDASFSWNAVSAFVHCRANLTVVKTSSSVDGAGLIGDFVVSHPFEGVVCLTTVAAEIFVLAGNDNLG